ncbi:MAG: response regulator [Sphingobacteriales bacterium]|jgi:two-component system invasion response regulator UvrY
MRKTLVGLADDHKLLRSALASMINSFGEYEVVLEASNGVQLLEYLKTTQPDIVLLDFNMPEMNGLEAAEALKKSYPSINVLMLTMFDTELMLIKLLQAGVKGFMKKDIHPSDLKQALEALMKDGYYYSTYTSNKLAGFFRNSESSPIWDKILSEQEIRLLKLSSTELTYKEIAIEMGLNPRTIDSIRDGLFEKLDVKSRVGLAMYAIKHGLVTI